MPRPGRQGPFIDIQRMNLKKSVSILGCGWLGLPLAKQFLAEGYQVKGSTASPEKLDLLQAQGLKPYLFHLSDQELPVDFLQSDILVIAVPPGRTEQGRADYLSFFQKFSQLQLPSCLQHILFVSSTSVYGDHNTLVDEQTKPQSDEPSGKLLAEVEQLLATLPITVCLLRCGGLIGPQRHPGRFFAGRSAIPNGMAPVNLIHLDDVLAISSYAVQEKLSGPLNAVAPSHPSRSEFYTRAAMAAGLASPSFQQELLQWKQVEPDRLLAGGYQFKYPDLLSLLHEKSF
jgi:nucleoside-diphosphate-sugar epimerase